MLRFKAELNKIFEAVKEDYENQEFIEILYPPGIEKDTWEFYQESIELPKLTGSIFCIFTDSDKDGEGKELLYIGKSKDLNFSLFNHLKRSSSPRTQSILSTVKDIICGEEKKKIYVKVIDLRPVELASTLKPYLIKEYEPLLCQRLS